MTRVRKFEDVLEDLDEPTNTIDSVVSKIRGDQLFRDAFEKSPNGTLLLDDKGRIKYLNFIQAKYFGFDDMETVTRHLTGMVLFKEARFFEADFQTNPDEGLDLNSEKYENVLKKLLEGEEQEMKSSQVEVVRGENRHFYNMFFQRYLDGLRVDMVDVTEEMARATTDSLTGAFNRAYLDRILLPELERQAEAYRRKVAETENFDGPKEYHVGAVYIDLKKFKNLNDERGHDSGDQMLKDVASLLRSNVKSGDSVIRLGGDEFLVICPGTSTEEELKHLKDRLLGAQKAYNLKKGDNVLHMNMDIGAVRGTGRYWDLVTVAESYMRENKRRTG